MSGQNRNEAPSMLFDRSFMLPAPNGHQEDIAEALDHIAKALSAIDHKLAILIAELDNDFWPLAGLQRHLTSKPS